MNLSMTIRTDKSAFIEFGLHFGPTTSISLGGNPKVFPLRVLVVKFQSLNAPAISTKFATAPFVVYSFPAQYPSPFCDGLNQVQPPVCVTSSVSFQASPSQPHALPLSYRGMRKNNPEAIRVSSNIFQNHPKVKKLSEVVAGQSQGLGHRVHRGAERTQAILHLSLFRTHSTN